MPALLPVLADKDAFLAFSARQALRRIGDWKAAARGLDSPEPKVREGVLLAMEQVYDTDALGRLIAVRRGGPASRSTSGRKAIRFLAEVHRKAPPWDGKWWGTQPANRQPPARTIAWERDRSGARGLPRVVARPVGHDPDRRRRRPGRGQGPASRAATIRSRFDGEKDAEVRRAMALALGKLEDRESLDMLDRRASATRVPRSRCARPRSRPWR